MTFIKIKNRYPSLIFFLCCFAGCFEQTAKISEPKGYDSNQISFEYPQNWEITEDTYTPIWHNIFLETPGDALVICQSFRSDLAEDLDTFAKSFSENARTETPIGKFSNSVFKTMRKETDHEWIYEQFDLSFFGEVVPHQRIYGTKKIADRQVFLIFQVANEDFSKAEPGFKLIWNTLRESKAN